MHRALSSHPRLAPPGPGSHHRPSCWHEEQCLCCVGMHPTQVLLWQLSRKGCREWQKAASLPKATITQGLASQR